MNIRKLLFVFLFSFLICGTSVYAETKNVNFNLLSGGKFTKSTCKDGEVDSNGGCNIKVTSGEKVVFPANGEDSEIEGHETYTASNQHKGLLMGWTTQIDSNGKPICVGSDYGRSSSIEKGKKSANAITSDVNYYACYHEVIDGTRYLSNDFLADDYPLSKLTVGCGDGVEIKYCTREKSGDLCHFTNNSLRRSVKRDKLASKEVAKASCKETVEDSDTEIINSYKCALAEGENYYKGQVVYVTSCKNDECNITKFKNENGGTTSIKDTIDIDDIGERDHRICEEYYSEDDDSVEIDSCSNKTLTKRKSSGIYKLCYKAKSDEEKIIDELEEHYQCDTENGYYFDKTYVVLEDNTEECDNSSKLCKASYKVRCTLSSNNDTKPYIEVTSGIVGSDGEGIIKVKAFAKSGKIDSYYVSDYYKTPTDSSKGWIELNGDEFSIKTSPGTQYIWVKDSNDIISNAVAGVVFDTVNSNTTLAKLELYDSKGNLQTPSRTTAYNNSIKSSKYVMLSNDLNKDSRVIADGFNPYDMEYKLEVSSPTIAVYATLTSNDSSYVDGYEPRTVNLDYGINTVLIKIRNKDGVIRTYTILVTRTDTRTSDNTLKDISLSAGSINFNSNVTEYKIEIPSDINEVNVKSEITSDKAKYVSGYEPGIVKITGDTTVKLIKVQSEAGSTRTYVLNFIKKGTDLILDETLQLRDLKIPDVYIPFDKTVANYSISVNYENDLIDINAVLSDNNSYYYMSIKRNGESNYGLISGEGVKLEVGENLIEIKIVNSNNESSYYRLNIIRKEFGLDVSNDKTLKDLKVLGYYNIDFKPNKKDYTVRIKQEKSLVITAVPNNDRAEVFIRGNEELTGFSTVRVKVVAENGEYETYSINIEKDAFNKTIEIIAIIIGAVIILGSSGIIIIKEKRRKAKEYFEE